MAYTHENIIVGAADVYVAHRYDESGAVIDLPTFTASAKAKDAFKTQAATGPWRHVGLTSGGVEFTYAPDFGEVDVDQYLDVAKMFKQGQSVTVNTTFAEATLENLLFAWGQAGTTFEAGAGDADDDILTIHGGSLGAAPEERQLALVGPAPSPQGKNKERVYHLERVLSVESSAHSLSKTESTTVPVSLRCLPAEDDSSGEVTYGRIIERTIGTAGG